MPTDRKGGGDEEPQRQFLRRSTRASSAQPTFSAASSARKSTASPAAPPKKSACSVTKSETQEDDEKRPLRRTRRASSAEPTSSAHTSPPKLRKSAASSSQNPESSSTSRKASILVNIPEGTGSDDTLPAMPTKPDGASAVGTPRRRGRASIAPVVASPARLTRRTAAALAALESSNSPEMESNDKSSENCSPSKQKPAVEAKADAVTDQKSDSDSPTPKVPSQTSKTETPNKNSPSSRIPVHTSNIATPNKHSPNARSSNVTDRVNSPGPGSPSIEAAIEASRVSTPTSDGSRSRTATPTGRTPIAFDSHVEQSPSARVRSKATKVSTPTHQSPVSAISSPSGQSSTPSRKLSLRSRSSTPTHSPDTRASTKSHKNCHTPPTQSPEIRSSARSSVRSTGSNRSTPTHSPVTRSSLRSDKTPIKDTASEAKSVDSPVGSGESNGAVPTEAQSVDASVGGGKSNATVPAESIPETSETKEAEDDVEVVANEAKSPSPFKKSDINIDVPVEKKEEPSESTDVQEPATEGTALPEENEPEASETLEQDLNLTVGDDILEETVCTTTVESRDLPLEVDVSDPVLELKLDDVDIEEMPKMELSTVLEDAEASDDENDGKEEVTLATKIERKPLPDNAISQKFTKEETIPTVPEEDSSETVQEQLGVEGDGKEEVTLARKIESRPITADAVGKKCTQEDIISTVPETFASFEGSQRDSSKLGKHSTSGDLRINVDKDSKLRLLGNEERCATPEDRGTVSVKLTPPRRRKSSGLSPKRLDVENEEGTKRSPKRKLSGDFSLKVDEADFTDNSPGKQENVAKVARISTPKTPSTLSELTKCVSPLMEGRKTPLLSQAPAAILPKSQLNQPLVNNLPEPEKSPRARDGSPIVVSGAPDSPEVSPIASRTNFASPSSKSSSPKILKGSEVSEKSVLASPGQNLKSSSDSAKVAVCPENSPDLSSCKIITPSPDESPKMTGAQNPPSTDGCSPAQSLEVFCTNQLPPANESSVESISRLDSTAQVQTHEDEESVTDPHQKAWDVSNEEAADLEDSCTKDVPPTPVEDAAEESSSVIDHSPGKSTSERDGTEPDPPKDIIACDEESVDSGNASEDEEMKKRKNRVMKEPPIEVTSSDSNDTRMSQSLIGAESKILLSTELKSADDQIKAESPPKAVEPNTLSVEQETSNDSQEQSPTKVEQVQPEQDASELELAEVSPTAMEQVQPEQDASDLELAEDKPKDAGKMSFDGRKSLRLNATQYSSLTISSSCDEDEYESEDVDDDESVQSDQGDESSDSDEELLDVSSFSPAERSRRVSFLEQSCVIVSDDELEDEQERPGLGETRGEPTNKEEQKLVSVGNVNKFLVTDLSPIRACTPGKVKDIIAKFHGTDSVVASSSAIGFLATDAPPTPAGAKRHTPATFASSTATQFIVEKDSAPTKKKDPERSSKRKADEGHLKSPPMKVLRPDDAEDDSSSDPRRVIVSNIPKDTPLPQLKAALKQVGIAVGLESVNYVKLDGSKTTKTALASYNSMRSALNAVSFSAKLKLNGNRIFLLMVEEGQDSTISKVGVCDAAAGTEEGNGNSRQAPKKASSPQKKFCGIISNLPPNTTISEVTAAFEKFDVKDISQVKIFRLKSHHDSVYAKIKFYKKSTLLRAIVVSDHIDIQGRKINMKIKQQPTGL